MNLSDEFTIADFMKPPSTTLHRVGNKYSLFLSISCTNSYTIAQTHTVLPYVHSSISTLIYSTYTHTLTHRHTHTHTHTHTYTHRHTDTHTHTHTHTLNFVKSHARAKITCTQLHSSLTPLKQLSPLRNDTRNCSSGGSPLEICFSKLSWGSKSSYCLSTPDSRLGPCLVPFELLG